MKSIIQWLCALLNLTLMASAACAYDLDTHAWITYKAYQKSDLDAPSSSLRTELGLDRLNATDPFRVYWDSLQLNSDIYLETTYAPNKQPSITYQRTPDEFERCVMQGLVWVGQIDGNDSMVGTGTIAVSEFPIQNWIIRGAVREDDLSAVGYFISPEFCGIPPPNPDSGKDRVLQHFYDPIHDTGMQTVNAVCGGLAPGGSCIKSIDWAMGYSDSFSSAPSVNWDRANHFSWEDARLSMWNALTLGRLSSQSQPNLETAADRAKDAETIYANWATTFRALGDVLHLLQDGAQPQHVRADPHSPYTTSNEQQAYERYTNARVLKNVSRLNPYIRCFFPGCDIGPYENFINPPVPIGTYPAVRFSTPQRYFTTRSAFDGAEVSPDNRLGLMDYSNRGFFTGGTLPDMEGNTFQRPATPIDEDNLYVQTDRKCFMNATYFTTDIMCRHWTAPVPDSVVGAYPDEYPSDRDGDPFLQAPILEESVFAMFSNMGGGGGIPVHVPRYVMGVEEFQASANLAIPRAIGYSSGLINYFFRGVGGIQLTPPDDGVYAILDQGQPHSMNESGYPCKGSSGGDGCEVFGFEKLRIKVQKNMSPIVESAGGSTVPQKFANGALVAIARYHRNTCYKPDLSGMLGVDSNTEYSTPSGDEVPFVFPANCSGINDYTGGRSAFMEISVSNPIPVDANGKFEVNGTTFDINSDSASLIEFSFAGDAIPINATDLFVEVAFQGQIGDVAKDFGPGPYEEDSVAMGSIDVTEPTYETFMNLTTYVHAWGTDYAPYTGWSTEAQAENIEAPRALPYAAPQSLNICLGSELLASTNGVTDSSLIIPHGALRLAAIFDEQAPSKANLTIQVPYGCAVYDSSGNCSDALYYYGLMGPTYTWVASTDFIDLAPSVINAHNTFVVHIDQYDKEKIADVVHYVLTPVARGLSVNWGDNFYFGFYGEQGDGVAYAPVTKPFPDGTMSGVSGGVLATALPTAPTLGNVQSSICP